MSLSSPEIIARLRLLIEQSRLSQAQFARRIGIDPANLSKHLSGRLPVTEGLINRVVADLGVSKKWLRDGIDVPYPKPVHAVDMTPGQCGSIMRSERSGVPVYDIDVTAGFGNLSQVFTEDKIMGFVDLPDFIDSRCRIVRVTGDSMEPTISNGGFVALREVGSRTIFWGQIYVVVLDDYRMVKVIRRHTDPSKVILHSFNPAYDDMEIDRDEIRGCYLVEAILNCSIRC